MTCSRWPRALNCGPRRYPSPPAADADADADAASASARAEILSVLLPLAIDAAEAGNDALRTVVGRLVTRLAGAHADAFRVVVGGLSPETKQRLGRALAADGGGGRGGGGGGEGVVTARAPPTIALKTSF